VAHDVQVTDADPGHTFAFTVAMLGATIAEWSYRVEPTDGGCRVTERWTDRRSGWVRRVDDGYVCSMLRTADRRERNRQDTRTTLATLQAKVEAGGG